MPLNPSSSLAKLLNAPVRPGKVIWIGTRASRRSEMQVMTEALLEAGRGLIEDHYSRFDGDRQVTLIESENLATIASHLGKGEVMPKDLRRNLVIQGINLLAFKDRQFRIGEAILETSGECYPCSRMEELLGIGGYNAVRGLGGIIARVVRGSWIHIGDVVEPLYLEIES